MIPKAFVVERTRFSVRVVENFHFYCFEANDKNSCSVIFLSLFIKWGATVQFERRVTFLLNNDSTEGNVMANRYLTNGAQTGQARLPPIRRKYGSINNPMFQDFKHENLPSSLPRLPQVENRRLLAAKTSSFLELPQERNIKSFFTDDQKVPPLRLAAIEPRNPLKRSTESRRQNGERRAIAGSGVRSVDDIHFDGDQPKNETLKDEAFAENTKPFRRPAQLLRRRLRPNRAYMCQHSDGQISHGELLRLDQNMDQLCAFAERDNVIEVKDFNGEKIEPNKTGNCDITSYMGMFAIESKADSNSNEEGKCASTVKTDHDTDLPRVSEETKKRVRGRFYEALDLHFYHNYRNAHPERRMAICEEIERTIVVDNITLSWFRENLRLQDVLNIWML